MRLLDALVLAGCLAIAGYFIAGIYHHKQTRQAARGTANWTEEKCRIMGTEPIDWVALGREHFERHRQCAILQAHFPVEVCDGWLAIKAWYPPEDQGPTKMMMQRPHDAWRTQWVQGWDAAREEWLQSQLAEEEAPK